MASPIRPSNSWRLRSRQPDTNLLPSDCIEALVPTSPFHASHTSMWKNSYTNTYHASGVGISFIPLHPRQVSKCKACRQRLGCAGKCAYYCRYRPLWVSVHHRPGLQPDVCLRAPALHVRVSPNVRDHASSDNGFASARHHFFPSDRTHGRHGRWLASSTSRHRTRRTLLGEYRSAAFAARGRFGISPGHWRHFLGWYRLGT